ncbi:MAG TPA: hypothetical protein VGP40_05850, partial [Chthoniobacterales bacterium]|nr:hypothetical protein [Chthoniobacterales bacterium]
IRRLVGFDAVVIAEEAATARAAGVHDAPIGEERAQTVPFEIIVVDAQSTDETLALARSAACQAA